MLRVCFVLLLCVVALGASPVAVPEAAASPEASPVADPAAAPAPAPTPVAEAKPVVPVVAVEPPAAPETVVKEDVETVAKVQEVQQPVAPKARSLDDDFFSNNDVTKGGHVVVADTTTGEEALLRKLNTRCAQKDTSSCVLLKMVTYFNRLLKKSSIAIGETVEIERTSTVSVSSADDSARALEGETDEDKLSTLVTDKLYNFVRSRSLRLRMLPSTDMLITPYNDETGALNIGMSFEASKFEGRGKKAQSIIPAMVAAGVVKLGVLGVLAMKGIVLLVGKAIILAKIAFIVALIIGLQKLFLEHRYIMKYETIAQQQNGGHPTDEEGPWGRSLGRSLNLQDQDAHHLAYRAHH